MLLTSELVTNAITHGGPGPVRLSVEASPDRVRVEVGDDSDRQPRVPAQHAGSLGGRGILIVEALAATWGVTQTTRGKIVWFEVPAQP